MNQKWILLLLEPFRSLQVAVMCFLNTRLPKFRAFHSPRYKDSIPKEATSRVSPVQ